MTNRDAASRLEQKLQYTLSKAAENPTDERANFYRRLDCDAFELAIAALEFTEQMRIYEESQVPRE